MIGHKKPCASYYTIGTLGRDQFENGNGKRKYVNIYKTVHVTTSLCFPSMNAAHYVKILNLKF